MSRPTMLFDTMQVHVVDNVKRKDEKYWLPGQPEEAYFCVRVCMKERLQLCWDSMPIQQYKKW